MKTIRTYFAGLGSGGALLAAVIAGFLSLGALVAFDGLPQSSAQSDDGVVIAQSKAPEIAAAAATAPAAAPAATPTPVAAAAAGATAGGPSPAGPGPGASNPPGGNAGPPDGPSSPNPPGGNPDPPTPGPTPPAPGPGSGQPGDVAGVVDQVDDTVNDATGLDLDLGGKTEPITGIVDKTVKDLTGGKGLGLGNAELPDLPRVVELGGLNGIVP